MRIRQWMAVCAMILFLPCGVMAAPAATLEDMAGQMLMVGFRGTGEPGGDSGFDVLLDAVAKGYVGGVILFDRDSQTKRYGRNIQSLKQVTRLNARLQSRARIPLFIAVDQEGGKVQRLRTSHGMPDAPSPEDMGKGTLKANRDLWNVLARRLADAGINVNFAPSLDMNVNPASPAIGALGRSYAADGTTVANHAREVALALQQGGVIPCFKHFPGHGSATADTHEGIADITATWTDKELEPYKTLLSRREFTRYGMVMAGHLVHTGLDAQGLPATLSPAMIQDLLRGRMGWQGVVITDDLQMKAITSHYSRKETVLRAIRAGADILLFGNNLEYDPEIARKLHADIVDLVRSGAISQERIRASYERIMALKANCPGLQKK